MDRFYLYTDSIELKDEDDNSYVYGYISTKDKDLVNDMVTDNCLKSMFHQMKNRTIKFDIEHESFRGDSDLDREINKTLNPIAKVDWFGLDANGLMVKAVLNKHHPRFEEVKGSIKDGFLDAFSIAYIPTKVEEIETKDETIRKLDDINLLNVAFTGNPVNQSARITDVFMKSIEAMEEKEKYPWDQCIRDQMKKYGSKEKAEKICGAIRAGKVSRKAVEEFDAVSELIHGSALQNKNPEGLNMETEKKSEEVEKTEEKAEKVEVKSENKTENLEEKLNEISASLKSIVERLEKVEAKGESDEKEEKQENEELKSLKKELEDLKKSPVLKSVQTETKDVSHEIEAKGPLDFI